MGLKIQGVFSETYQNHAAALTAAATAAAKQKLPGPAEAIQYQDSEGNWHDNSCQAMTGLLPRWLIARAAVCKVWFRILPVRLRRNTIRCLSPSGGIRGRAPPSPPVSFSCSPSFSRGNVRNRSRGCAVNRALGRVQCPVTADPTNNNILLRDLAVASAMAFAFPGNQLRGCKLSGESRAAYSCSSNHGTPRGTLPAAQKSVHGARRCLAVARPGTIVTLLKPHAELF